MNPTAPARARARRALWLVPVGLVVIAAVIGSLGYESSGQEATPERHQQGASRRSSVPRDSIPTTWSSATPAGEVLGDHHGALGEADGLVPDGTAVFDDRIPAVANLDPRLLAALRRAATAAAEDGVGLQVNSGWRSPEYQDQLLREAVSEHGSAEEAARWVATPNRSAHVSGDAVDVGPVAATAWLAKHGVHYGLCQIYRNETWHFELRPEANSRGCPRMYADPTHDPRMSR